MGNHGDRDGLFVRKNPSGHPVWYYRFTWMGRDVKKVGGKTKEEAKKKRRAALTDLERGVVQLKPTTKDTIAGVLERYRPIGQRQRNYPKTQAFYIFWIEQIGTVPLRKLSPAQVEQAQQTLVSQKKSPATVNRYTDFLRHVLHREVRYGNLLTNPVTRIRRMKESQGRFRFLSMEEEARLLKAIGPIHAPCVRLAILTGLRQAEQFQLKWTDVDLELSLLTLSQTKAGGCQYAILNKEAREILLAMKARATSEWVFSSQNTQTPIDPKNFYNRVYVPALLKSGLRMKRGKKSPPEEPGQKVDWHTLRHTFASRLGMSGATEQDIAACLRHSSTSLVKRYAHLSPTYLHGVTELVSRFGRDPVSRLEHFADHPVSEKLGHLKVFEGSSFCGAPDTN